MSRSIKPCNAILAHPGFQFGQHAHGDGKAMATQSGADICPVAVQVDASQGHAGVQWVNGQFMGTVIVGEGNQGP